MKAISMWQPWASLYLTDAKLFETRGRDFHHRGWTLVHAGKHIVIEIDHALSIIAHDRLGWDWAMRVGYGALIGAVNITDVHTTEFLMRQWADPNAGGMVKTAHWEEYQCGDYSQRRYGIERAPEVKVFTRPIPYRGMQAMPFDVPEDVIKEAMGR